MSDTHSHYCRQCRTPWEHDGETLSDADAIRAAHRCPACGTEGWSRYYGTETHEQMVELEALLAASQDERLPERTRWRAELDFAKLAQKLHRPKDPSPPRLEFMELMLDMLGG